MNEEKMSALSFHSWCSAVLLGCLMIAMPNRACAQPRESGKGRSASGKELSPAALVAAADGRRLYIAYASAGQVAVLDVEQGKVTRIIAVPASPVGLALSSDGTRLYVTCAAPVSTVCVIDTIKGIVLQEIRTGYHAMAPVLSPDGKTLYVCNRFSGNISVINVTTLQEQQRIPVAREPVAAAITKDGQFLLVANHLPNNRADQDYAAPTISVIDLAAAKVSREIALPNGSSLVRDIRVSPDGQYACVTHLLGRFHLPATQLDRGWVETNALTLIDVAKLKLINTVLLDEVDSGAANPWAAAWSADGKRICVTHAGTHEVSIIDRAALFAKLSQLTVEPSPKEEVDPNSVSRPAADVSSDFSFLLGLRHRIKLGDQKGPRAIAVLGNKIYTANYFSDSLSELILDSADPVPRTIRLGEQASLGAVRKGEILFNDATIGFQGWLSCASCHSDDARVDGMNWDLLNDGIGNPKNTKSLLKAFEVAPTTWLGVRENASTSIRAGLRSILFAARPEEDARALDAYIGSLQPMPSPYLENGTLSEAARRGQKIFNDESVGCATCHRSGLLTDRKRYDVGTCSQYDKPSDKFVTPPLIELWRTAPYLHDGSAATLRGVLTTLNRGDRHGKTSQLTERQIDDLVIYLLSL